MLRQASCLLLSHWSGYVTRQRLKDMGPGNTAMVGREQIILNKQDTIIRDIESAIFKGLSSSDYNLYYSENSWYKFLFI